MPLPDERHSQSVANLIGRFEQQTKKQLTSSPGARSSSVASHTTGDSAKEETREKREWPPRTSNVASPPNESKFGNREWPPRLSAQSTGDSSGQRWPPVQPIIQASPFSELKRSPTSPLAKREELATPPEVTRSPSPPPEPPKVIEVTPPSREPTIAEPEPQKPVEPEPVDPADTPKSPPQPTIAPPTTTPRPSSVATKPPSKAVKPAQTKPNTKPTSKPPPSSFSKGAPPNTDVKDRRTPSSAQQLPRPTSRTNLRSKTPTSTPARPPSSTRRGPPTETPKHASTPVRRPKTPSTSPRHLPSTPTKPPPVIPKTPNSRLYAPTAASLAKSANSPQPPLPERKKTLSSEVSLERLSKPTASSLSKSRSIHSLASTTSPPRSKPTPSRTGTLNTNKKTTTMNKPGGKTKPAGSTPIKTSNKKDGDPHENGNGNGLGEALSTTGETLHPETEPSDAGNNDLESDCGHEHFGNGSFEASYTEEPSGTTDGTSGHDHEEAVDSSVDRDFVEEPEELVRSHSPESGDPPSNLHADDGASPELPHEGASLDAPEQSKQELVRDDIADMVGLLESTSFTSKHIYQGSDEAVANDLHTKERQGIGEIPDEE